MYGRKRKRARFFLPTNVAAALIQATIAESRDPEKNTRVAGYMKRIDDRRGDPSLGVGRRAIHALLAYIEAGILPKTILSRSLLAMFAGFSRSEKFVDR